MLFLACTSFMVVLWISFVQWKLVLCFLFYFFCPSLGELWCLLTCVISIFCYACLYSYSSINGCCSLYFILFSSTSVIPLLSVQILLFYNYINLRKPIRNWKSQFALLYLSSPSCLASFAFTLLARLLM